MRRILIVIILAMMVAVVVFVGFYIVQHLLSGDIIPFATVGLAGLVFLRLYLLYTGRGFLGVSLSGYRRNRPKDK
jgi:hypothetical protein